MLILIQGFEYISQCFVISSILILFFQFEIFWLNGKFQQHLDSVNMMVIECLSGVWNASKQNSFVFRTISMVSVGQDTSHFIILAVLFGLIGRYDTCFY